jgi:hypothetical protein
MKHLLSGVAMAAALAIAAPVWAQNAPSSAPMTPPPAAAPASPAPAAKAPAATKPAAAKPAAAKPMAEKPTAKKPMHHMAMHHKPKGDQMTEDLNKQELQRLQGGVSAPPAAPMTPGGNNPTSGTAGPFAPSPSMSAPPPPAK